MARLRLSKGTARLGNQRTYYVAAAPARAVIIFHRGLNVKRLAGRRVEARVTTAKAPVGIARPGNEDKPHTIVILAKKLFLRWNKPKARWNPAELQAANFIVP